MTQPSQISVRQLRHSIRKRLFKALQLTGGAPGLNKDQQLQVLDMQIHLITEALEKAQQARDIAFLRDHDEHQAAKAATAQQQSATEATFAELVAGLAEKFDASQGKFIGLEEDQPQGENETEDENGDPFPPF